MKFSTKEIESSIEEITKEYLKALLTIMSIDPIREREVNYFKTIVDTEQGGKYLFMLHHIEGPKIELKKHKKKKKNE